MKRCYLAGSITGLSYNQATDWRKYATDRLRPIEALSPMRAKEFLENMRNIANFTQDQFDSPFVFPEAIVGRDRNDVLTSDVILMNLLGAKRVSLGTMVELGWADIARKPVVVVWEGESNPHYHEFVKGLAAFRVTDLDSGIAVVKTVVGV